MSDLNTWTQKLILELLGVRVAIPPAPGLQEAIVTKVGTYNISVAGQPSVELPVVYFTMNDIFGEAIEYGPAAYQSVPGWEPTTGTPCLVEFVGNGLGRPYVVSFPTANYTFAVPSGATEFLEASE